jgi:hypothetical protein
MVDHRLPLPLRIAEAHGKLLAAIISVHPSGGDNSRSFLFRLLAPVLLSLGFPPTPLSTNGTFDYGDRRL